MEPSRQSNASLHKKLQKLSDKDYRDGFLETDVKGGIAYQIQALREKAGLSQEAFAKKIGTKQSVVSRLENTEYGGMNVNTLLEIAKALDIGLQIRFCDYIEVIKRDISPKAMKVDTIFETVEKVKNISLEISRIIQTGSRPFSMVINTGELPWFTNQPKGPTQPFLGSATPISEIFTRTTSSSACHRLTYH